MKFLKVNGYKFSTFLVLVSGVVTFNIKIVNLLTDGSNFHLTKHPIITFFGFLLLYVSFQLYLHKRLALIISVIVVLTLLLFAITKGHIFGGLVYLITLILLLLTKNQFYVKSNNLNLKRALFMSGFVVLLAFIYGVVGLYLIDKKMFNHDFTFLESIKYSFIQLMSFDNGLLHPVTHQAKVFLRTLDVISIGALTITLINLFRPVKFELFINTKDIKRATKILEKYSTSTEDYFLIWPQDKHYFFTKTLSAFLAYKVQSGVALVLTGPIGTKDDFGLLMKDFKFMCNSNGWLVSIINANSETKQLVEQIDINSIFVGNEAIIDIEVFCKSTVSDKHFRYVTNKAKSENLSTEFWQPPHSKASLQQLKQVSKMWLSLPSRREYSFFMSPFSESYINKCKIIVLKQNNKLIAYANLIPSYTKSSASIDHMRHLPNIPSIGMHFLLKSLIEQLAKLNYKWFNLGLSPLAGLTEVADPTIKERILLVVKIIGSKYYSFGGLEQFKNKFRPKWQPQYILYEGNITNAIKITKALSGASLVSKQKTYKRNLHITLGLVASLGYVGFMLTYPLGLSVYGFASNLEQRGSAYSWLFITVDVVAGLIITYLALRGIRQSKSSKLEIKYSLFALGGLCNILSTLAPIRGSAHNLHLIFSAISILGFFSAILLDNLQIKNKNKKLILITLTTTMFCIGGASVNTSPYVGGLLQRVQLFYIAIYIFVFSKKITRYLK